MPWHPGCAGKETPATMTNQTSREPPDERVLTRNQQ